ncbi:MAG: secondary thiamine-phosphate synthase enzyme YjbQ [Chloroflexota bacterium]
MLEQDIRHGFPVFSTHVETLEYQTSDAPQFIDITEAVAFAVERSEITNGIAVVFSQHTTAAVKINESEPELIKDMARFLKEIAPVEREYFHNNFDVRTVNMTKDECPNAHSHCQHLMLSAGESVPVIGGRLHLGKWQRVFLVELDRAKARQVTVQILGV